MLGNVPVQESGFRSDDLEKPHVEASCAQVVPKREMLRGGVPGLAPQIVILPGGTIGRSSLLTKNTGLHFVEMVFRNPDVAHHQDQGPRAPNAQSTFWKPLSLSL